MGRKEPIDIAELRRSSRIDDLRSPKVTHTENTICSWGKRKTISSAPKYGNFSRAPKAEIC